MTHGDLEELRQRIDQLEALHRISISMSSSLDLEEVLAALARELVSAIPRASQSTVSLVTNDRQALRDIVSHSQADGPLHVGDRTFPLSVYRRTAELLESQQGAIA